MRRINLLSALVATSVSTGVLASGTSTVNGFATIGASMHNESDLRYGQLGTMTNGADLVGASRIGVQADHKFNKQFSVTAQGILKSDASNNEKMAVTGEWLFGTYSVMENTKVRFGKLRLPLFMLSEQLDVGKSYVMASLPTEMYGMTPTNSYHGVDALVTAEIGEGELMLQPYFGNSRFEGRNTVNQGMSLASGGMYQPGQQAYNAFEADAIKGLNLVYMNDNQTMTLRAGLLQTTLYDRDGMTTLFAQMPGMAGFSANGVDAQFASMGAQFKFGQTTLTSEYGQRRVESAAFPATDGYYINLAHKLSSFTPYLTYSAIASDKDKWVKGTQAPIQEQSTLAVGLVYDVNASSNVKAEVAQVIVGKDNNFNYFATQATTGNALSDSEFNTYRVSYNLLF